MQVEADGLLVPGTGDEPKAVVVAGDEPGHDFAVAGFGLVNGAVGRGDLNLSQGVVYPVALEVALERGQALLAEASEGAISARYYFGHAVAELEEGETEHQHGLLAIEAGEGLVGRVAFIVEGAAGNLKGEVCNDVADVLGGLTNRR